MVDLDNSNRRLLEGLVLLLRDKVDGWSISEEHSVDNVWSKSPPESVSGEFPRGVVDIISGNDFDLSVELDVKLREVTVKLVVFGEVSGAVEDLIDDSEDAIDEHWDDVAASSLDSWSESTYLGDWSFRETDGFTQTVEDEGVEQNLRFNRSQDFVFETVKTTR